MAIGGVDAIGGLLRGASLCDDPAKVGRCAAAKGVTLHRALDLLQDWRGAVDTAAEAGARGGIVSGTPAQFAENSTDSGGSTLNPAQMRQDCVQNPIFGGGDAIESGNIPKFGHGLAQFQLYLRP